MKRLNLLGIKGVFFAVGLILSLTCGFLYLWLGDNEYIISSFFLLSMVFTGFLVKGVIHKLELLNNVTASIDNEELPEIDKEIANAVAVGHLKSLYFKIQEIIEFVKNLGNKEFKFKYINPKGSIGRILISHSEKQQEYLEKEHKRNWKNEGLAKFGEILRMDDQDLKTMSTKVITNIVRYVKANQGGFFIEFDEEDGSRFMELTACYAYDRKKFIEAKIEAGQGLLGQVMLEKDIINLTDVPQDFVNITSGLGEATPKNIIIVPLMVNDHFYGAMELASFEIFEPYKIEFLKEVAENIASTVATVKTSEQTQNLLFKSQQLAQELASGEEEMRQNMEELKATQEDMERSQLELKGLFSALDNSQGLAEIDTKGQLLSANKRLLDILSYSSTKELQENVGMLLPDDELDFFSELEHNQNITMELLVQSRFGNPVWLNVNYSSISDNQGQFKKLLMFATDISSKKEKEKEFERLSLVANNTDNSVIITDTNGITEYVNQGFTRLSGYSEEELIGKKPGEILQGPDTDKQTVLRISEKIKNKQPLYEEILNYNKDGNPYWISLAINPVFNEEGTLTKYISIQTDITETKEKALDYHYQLQAIGRANAIIEFDVKGTIIEANDNFLEIFKYKKEEIIGKHHEIFVLPEERNSQEYREFWSILSNGEFINREFNRVDKHGKEVWLRGIYNPIFNLQGKVVKIVKFATDITNERHLQLENLIQTEIKSHLETIDKTIASLEFDMDGKISYVNQIYQDVSGYTKEELVGKNYEFLLHDDEMDKQQTQMIWISLNAGNYFNGQFRQKSKEGKSLWLSGTLNPILDSTGKPVKVMMFALFNTQEKEKYQSLLQTVNAVKNAVPIIELNKDGSFKTANQKFFDDFGYSRIELRQKPLNFFLDDKMPSNKLASFLEKLNHHVPLEEELSLLKKSGDRKTYRASFTPVSNMENEIVKTVVILLDIVPVLSLNPN